jgi:hypothetical protein
VRSTSEGRLSKGRTVVVLVLVAALVFGLYLGYLAWTNNTFPAREGRFSDYANVASSTFNGTEYAFRLQWLSDSVPAYAQLTSSVSDSANTPVCETGLREATMGQTIFMPFGLSSPSTSLSQVDLLIAVRAANGTMFTIVYHVDTATAIAGNIQPQNFSCSQPSTPM